MTVRPEPPLALTAALPRQDVVDEPFPLLLTNDRLANHSALLQHVVRGLKDALQVRRIALCERKLFAQTIESDSPRKHVASPRNFDEPIQASSDRRWQRQ